MHGGAGLRPTGAEYEAVAGAPGQPAVGRVLARISLGLGSPRGPLFTVRRLRSLLLGGGRRVLRGSGRARGACGDRHRLAMSSDREQCGGTRAVGFRSAADIWLGDVVRWYLLYAVGAIFVLYILAQVFRLISRLGGAVVFGIAVFLGMFFPDVDQIFPYFGQHRSAITHSVLAVLILSWLAARHAAGGLSAGTGLHLSADLFPNAWTGYATIKVPFIGSIGLLSFVWIIVNALAAVYIAAYFIKFCWPRQGSRVVVSVGLLGTAYVYEITWEKSLLAMAVFCCALAFSMYHARPHMPIERLADSDGLAGAPMGRTD